MVPGALVKVGEGIPKSHMVIASFFHLDRALLKQPDTSRNVAHIGLQPRHSQRRGTPMTNSWELVKKECVADQADADTIDIKPSATSQKAILSNTLSS